jgi:hypothetical protein
LNEAEAKVKMLVSVDENGKAVTQDFVTEE